MAKLKNRSRQKTKKSKQLFKWPLGKRFFLVIAIFIAAYGGYFIFKSHAASTPPAIHGYIAVHRNNTFYLKIDPNQAEAQATSFGLSTDKPFLCQNQLFTIPENPPAHDNVIAVFRDGTVYMQSISDPSRTSNFKYGTKGDIPLCGDWDGNGIKTIGLKRGNTYYLKNSNLGGNADITFSFGTASDVPVVGDWDGNGTETIGIYRGNTFYLRNDNSAGNPDKTFSFGKVGDKPIAGYFGPNTSSTTSSSTVGIVRANVWYLKYSLSGGNADYSFSYGLNGDLPMVLTWQSAK